MSPRLAPYPDRQAGLTPRLVLEPVELLPPLPPGAVTLWEGSEPPGALWIGSQNAGAWRWEAGRLTAFATQDLVPRGAQQGPLLDGAGNVWAIGGAGQLVRYDGARWTEEPLTLHDLYTSDECFCTATRIEVLPIVWLDGRAIGTGSPGPVTARLTQALRDLAAREGVPVYP